MSQIVCVGQVWQNNDPRRQGSTVVITSVEGAFVHGYSTRHLAGRELRRAVVIAKEKFGDETSHGYRLISEASTTEAPVIAEQQDAEPAREDERVIEEKLAQENVAAEAVKVVERTGVEAQ
jgi:hypothetical protein